MIRTANVNRSFYIEKPWFSGLCNMVWKTRYFIFTFWGRLPIRQ